MLTVIYVGLRVNTVIEMHKGYSILELATKVGQAMSFFESGEGNSIDGLE